MAAKGFSFLQKIFFFTHFTGVAAGLIFPFLASIVLGAAALTPAFFAISVAMGFSLGAAMFFFVRISLKNQLRRQLELLRPLSGDVALRQQNVEGLEQAVQAAVAKSETFVSELLAAVDEFIPHYRSLAESSRYLSDRARDGLAAARNTRRDIDEMSHKQSAVMGQVQTLSERSQEEAALSRELSASLEEMASAMEHSTAKFFETTTSVDEMASSIREVAAQADTIARSVEGTAQDLDAIGDSLEKIRAGASNSARVADAVKKDAESGLQVVNSSREEMTRIEEESRRAVQAMQRLSAQTAEVTKIIEVIKGLVSDTELLAFNAAIIAAKAGEEGKGFSVVAEEIRDLADRTTTSAQDIHRIVKAIAGETREVTEAVEATGQRIAKGKQLSVSTGEALRKIVGSSSEAAAASNEIAALTSQQGERARALLRDAGQSLGSVKAIARAMEEQQNAILRIQEGVVQMKAAADQVARGMEEQVRANREFDRGLMEREGQIQAIHEATGFQISTSQRVFSHFASSEERLTRNAERADIILKEIAELEILATHLRNLASESAR